MRRAEPGVTGFERDRVGTPATGAERATLSGCKRAEFVEHFGRGNRPERTVRRRVDAAGAEVGRCEPRRAVLGGERDIVGRSMLLDFVRLDQRRLEGAWRDIERDPTRRGQHLQRPLRYAGLLPKVAVDATAERGGLPDVEDVATRSKHAID